MSAEGKGPTRRGLLTGGAVLAGAVGFNRLAGAEADPAQMISQTASFKLNPEKEAEALELVKTLCAAVESSEPGVLAYIAHRDQQNPAELVFFEIYADAEALRTHGQAPHLAPLRQAFATGVFAGPLKITKLDRVAGFVR